MYLNDIALSIIIEVRDLMSLSLENDLAGGPEDDVSYFICTNILRIIVNNRANVTHWSKMPHEWQRLEQEMLRAVHVALDGMTSFPAWLYREICIAGARLAKPDEFHKLYVQINENPNIVQQCRLAWLDKMIDSREIK